VTQPKAHHPLPDRLLSLNQTADFLGVSIDSVMKMIRGGNLPAVRVGPKLIRIRFADVERLLKPIVPRPQDVVA
jgi:excisionase family DNA binding protein